MTNRKRQSVFDKKKKKSKGRQISLPEQGQPNGGGGGGKSGPDVVFIPFDNGVEPSAAFDFSRRQIHFAYTGYTYTRMNTLCCTMHVAPERKRRLFTVIAVHRAINKINSTLYTAAADCNDSRLQLFTTTVHRNYCPCVGTLHCTVRDVMDPAGQKLLSGRSVIAYGRAAAAVAAARACNDGIIMASRSGLRDETEYYFYGQKRPRNTAVVIVPTWHVRAWTTGIGRTSGSLAPRRAVVGSQRKSVYYDENGFTRRIIVIA